MRRLLREVPGYLPFTSPRRVARGLLLRANAARDERRWVVAAALYEEVLRLTPTAVIHKQCGHMFKEAGQFANAEHHYLTAARLRPNDADLALQIGHFEKLRGEPDAAAAAYRRALELLPGWQEAHEGLRDLPASTIPGSGASSIAGLVPELLPTEPGPLPSFRELVRIFRLGRMSLIDGTFRRTAGGIEAAHGLIVARTPLDTIAVTLGGMELARQPLHPSALPGGLHKHAFNVWFDLSPVAPGSGIVELAFLQDGRRRHVHRIALEIVPPPREIDHSANDSVVAPPAAAVRDIVGWVNGRPSMARDAAAAPRCAIASPAAVRCLLVQRIDQLGDLIVSGPALARLRDVFPLAHIVLLASPANVAMARTLPSVDEVIVVEVTVEENGRRVIARDAQRALARTLAGRSIDVALDLSQGAESRPLLKLAGAAFTYGFRAASAPWLSASFDIHAPDRMNGLETCSPARKLLAMVDALHRLITPADLPRPGSGEPGQNAIPDGLPRRRYALLHGGARLEANRWPHFAELVRLLLRETDLDLVLIGLSGRVPPIETDRVHIVEGMPPFPTFDALTRHCAVFVGNDSGPKHLAAWRGAPTISLHLARLNWSEWGQEGRGVVMSRRVPCAGCALDRDLTDCGADFACLRHIRPEEVLAEIVRLTVPER